MTANASVQAAVSSYRDVLETHGPAGLNYLNSRVPHRYSGVYALSGGMLRNIYLFDKAGEIIPDFLKEVPLGDSFCQFVLRDGVFRTSDTAADSRLNGHKYQGTLGSYHGLPIVDNFQNLVGTICHFDTETHGMSEEEFEIFRQAAKLLPRYLHRRPLQSAAEPLSRLA